LTFTLKTSSFLYGILKEKQLLVQLGINDDVKDDVYEEVDNVVLICITEVKVAGITAIGVEAVDDLVVRIEVLKVLVV
jgi:hypothetical protein